MTKRLFWLSAMALILVVAGCASGGGGKAAAPAGPTDEEMVQQVVNSAIDALKAGDVDGMMGYYADDFSWDQGDKASMQAFLSQAAEAGFLEGMSIDMAAMEVMVEGESATVQGIAMEGAFGVLDLGFELAKRAGGWLVTTQTQQ